MSASVHDSRGLLRLELIIFKVTVGRNFLCLPSCLWLPKMLEQSLEHASCRKAGTSSSAALMQWGLPLSWRNSTSRFAGSNFSCTGQALRSFSVASSRRSVLPALDAHGCRPVPLRSRKIRAIRASKCRSSSTCLAVQTGCCAGRLSMAPAARAARVSPPDFAQARPGAPTSGPARQSAPRRPLGAPLAACGLDPDCCPD